jgi:hypothetical protein
MTQKLSYFLVYRPAALGGFGRARPNQDDFTNFTALEATSRAEGQFAMMTIGGNRTAKQGDNDAG